MLRLLPLVLVSLLAMACNASVRVEVGSVPDVLDHDESDLPAETRDFVTDTVETYFRGMSFDGLEDRMAAELAAYEHLESYVAGLYAVTGPLSGDFEVYDVLVWEAREPGRTTLIGEYIIAAEWEHGDGWLRLLVTNEDDELVILGVFGGLLTESQTIEDFDAYIRAQREAQAGVN